jgi:hypothetical protein
MEHLLSRKTLPLYGLWIIVLKTIAVHGLVTSKHSNTWMKHASQSRLFLSSFPIAKRDTRNVEKPDIGET